MQEYIDFLIKTPQLALPWVAVLGMLIYVVAKDKISGVTRISAQEATLLINKEDAIVVDVRSNADFQSGHIVNAKNITLSQIEKGTLSAIENNKQTPIIVVCETGVRSSSAAAKLVKAGFTEVTNLTSGMGGWASANFPTTKK